MLVTSHSESAYIPSTYAKALFRVIAERGYDPSIILTDEVLDVAKINRSEQLDAAVFGRMYQRAIRLLDDESLGMVSGGPVPAGTFRMMCLCIIHCHSLSAIVQRASEFLDICMTVGVKPELSEADGDACIGFATVHRETREIDALLARQTPLETRTSLYLWYSLLNWFAGRSLPLREVLFHFDKPERVEQWDDMFPCPVRFNSKRSMICFESGILDAPNAQSEQSLSLFLRSAPYRLIVPSFHDQMLRDRVLSLFGNDFTQPLPGASDVSRHLGVSVSTLRRQLNEEGTSFQQLKDGCRQAAALQYLVSNDLSLTEVSQLLGFDESSAFFRSFKRWTGLTPSEYRAGL